MSKIEPHLTWDNQLTSEPWSKNTEGKYYHVRLGGKPHVILKRHQLQGRQKSRLKAGEILDGKIGKMLYHSPSGYDNISPIPHRHLGWLAGSGLSVGATLVALIKLIQQVPAASRLRKQLKVLVTQGIRDGGQVRGLRQQQSAVKRKAILWSLLAILSGAGAGVMGAKGWRNEPVITMLG